MSKSSMKSVKKSKLKIFKEKSESKFNGKNKNSTRRSARKKRSNSNSNSSLEKLDSSSSREMSQCKKTMLSKNSSSLDLFTKSNNLKVVGRLNGCQLFVCPFFKKWDDPFLQSYSSKERIGKSSLETFFDKKRNMKKVLDISSSISVDSSCVSVTSSLILQCNSKLRIPLVVRSFGYEFVEEVGKGSFATLVFFFWLTLWFSIGNCILFSLVFTRWWIHESFLVKY